MPKCDGQCRGIRFRRSGRVGVKSYAAIVLRRAQKIVQPACMDFTLPKIACGEDAPEKTDVRLDAARIVFTKGSLEPRDGLGAVPAPRHKLAEHGIVFIGHGPAGI